ncbi:YbaB/EbfC family nucleoid-associated protein [Goodfellowiella coeruleoviolacea]|uniref:YbaB/EbfC DNA-binding family protein n=1 Tax=Goodfellowiella coeruleoviolacea TaxID=334858 RepID=A0AAE3GJF7_9PSEU|nr:YbaB/EbfC family nucleoid-associated protein [Goodfellowiella coeruleoviolacea]MCP2169351.1 YbaB/EbfC DNA-binding family protein [Goodfellowiella coeruleoviolacea]
MPDSVEAAEQMVSQWEKNIADRAQRYQQMADRVQGMSITEASRDGSVRVTISSNGLLTNLTIAESARDKRMSELSAQIMTCLQRAQSRIPELLQQAMAETIGTTDQTANALFADAKKRFPAPPPEEPGPAAHQVTREMRFGPADEDAPPPPPPAATPPAGPPPPAQPRATPPPRRRPPEGADEEDFGGQSYLS